MKKKQGNYKVEKKTLKKKNKERRKINMKTP